MCIVFINRFKHYIWNKNTFIIKCLPKIFKIAKRDENTTCVLEKKDFDSLFFVVVSCIVILFQFRKF